MTEESELTRRGGRLVYTEDEEGNRTLISEEPEHKAPEPKDPAPEGEKDAAEVPAVVQSQMVASDPPSPEPSTTDAVRKGAPEQKGKGK